MNRKTFFKTIAGVLVGAPIVSKLVAQPKPTKFVMYGEPTYISNVSKPRRRLITRKAVQLAYYVWVVEDARIVPEEILNQCLDHGYWPRFTALQSKDDEEYVYASKERPTKLFLNSSVQYQLPLRFRYIKNRFPDYVKMSNGSLEPVMHAELK